LAQLDAPVAAATLLVVETLRRVWTRHFERLEDGQHGGPRLRPVQSRGPGGRVKSPYDTEARFRAKADTTWTGYMVNFTETCDEGAPRLVIHADTTPANVHEAPRTAPIHAALAAIASWQSVCEAAGGGAAGGGLAPSEHLVDSAYVSADHLITARKTHDIDLVEPNRRNLSWQGLAEGAFSAAGSTEDRDQRLARRQESKESADLQTNTKIPNRRPHPQSGDDP